MTRLSKDDRAVLERLAGGWRALKPQIVSGARLEKRGLIRLDWGPEGTPDEDKLVWHITDAGRAALTPKDATP